MIVPFLIAVLAWQAPLTPSEYWSQATADYDADRYAAAAEGFAHVTKLSPQSAAGWAMLGLSEYELKRFDASLDHLERAHRLGLQDNLQIRHVAYYHEGILQLQKGRFEDAEKTLSALAADSVDSPELRQALGQSVLRTRTADSPPIAAAGIAAWEAAAGRPSAEDAYKKLIASFGSVPNIHYAYGRFLINAQRPEEALTAFRQELTVNPNHVLARLAIADTLRSRDAPACLPYATEAMKLAPNLPLSRYVLGMCLLDNRRPEKAIPELEQAARLLPQEPRVYYGLARAYSSAGRKADAAKASKTYQQLKNESVVERAQH